MAGRLLERLFPSPIEDPEVIRCGWMEGNRLHNFLVLLYHLARIPLPLCALAVAVLGASPVLLAEAPLAVAAVLGATMLGDLALLLALPRCGVSYGWPQPPWLLFAAGRSALATLVVALPLPPAVEVAAVAAVEVALSLLALYASLREPFALDHHELRVPLPGLRRPHLAVLLTDLHVERLTRRERAVIEAVRVRRPELVLLGGDLLNLSYVGEPRAISEARRLVEDLAAAGPPGGLFFVRGTVDVDPPEVVAKILSGTPVRVLEEERVTVDLGGGDAIHLVGVTATGTPEARAARLASALEGAGRPTVVLHHTPDLVEHAARLGVDLYLAGHTHGGQICLPLVGALATASRFGQRYVRGAHLLGATRAYVSRGIGLEGLGAPRMRFLARPEVVWISLDPLATVDPDRR
jgi:uncharacterized protein